MKKSGFTLIELAIALSIVGVGFFLATSIFTSIARFGVQAKHREKIITLESRLQSALYDINNYAPHKNDLKSNNTPSSIDFYYQKSSSEKIKVAEAQSGATIKTFFNSDLESCASASDPKCIYFIETNWLSFAKLKTQVGISQNQQNPFNISPREFEIPADYYNDVKSLSCPNDGKVYLGIRSYDFSTTPPTVSCWELDTSTTCPTNAYPVRISPKTGSTNTFQVECKSFPKIYCPAGYAPSKVFPVTTVNADLSNACTSILTSKIPLRFKHLSDLIASNTPPAHATHYGLKWISGKLCPDNYTLTAKAPYTGDPVSDFSTLFQIYDGINKSPCGAAQAVCGLDNDAFYCDLCPISGSSYKAGCTASARKFTTAADRSVDPSCPDPKVFALQSANLLSFRNNFECKLKSNLEFVDAQTVPF